MARKVKDTIEVQEAMDNLASIAGIDLEAPPPLAIIKKHQIVTSEEEFSDDTVPWLSSEGASPILEILDLTYRAIHKHLLKLYEDPEMNWESEKIRKGIAAMMELVGESANKIEAFLELRLDESLPGLVTDREDFQSLQKFYSHRFAARFDGGIEGEKAWQEEWNDEDETDAVLLDLSKTGLKDFETVQRDLEYELFYIRKEDGESYFTPEMLRNIKLSCDFDLSGESFEEDPLLKVRSMQDRDYHASASQILTHCQPIIKEYYKIAYKLDGNEFGMSLGMALIALFLAGNPRHLIQNTMGKSCIQYFEDFHRFLRKALRTVEYQKLIAYPPDSNDQVSIMLLRLVHALANQLFTRAGGVKQESIGLIHRSMRKGVEIKQQSKEKLLKGDSIWSQFSLDDEKMRTLLSKFPNGPLFKILDLIREEKDEDINIPFDPIGQDNLPMSLFHLEVGGKKTQVIRVPSPTRQSVIHKVEVIDEFKAYLRSLFEMKKTNLHLLINLQDRTSWKEIARTKALETLQMNAEFNSNLVVITLPKDTDFYYQNNEYLNLSDANVFIQTFKKQLDEPEEHGIFLPQKIKKTELFRFVEMILPWIHKTFFEEKKTLTRHNREDFIELFYQFLILKCIEMTEPSMLSFTCKDAIDVGASENASFYGFLKVLSEGLDGDEDFLRWLYYTPALFIRERAIDPERFNRSISMLERLDRVVKEKGEAVLKDFTSLLGSTEIKVKH